MNQADDFCCAPLSAAATWGNGLKLPFAARFHAVPVGLLLITLFATISPMIVMVSLAASLAGNEVSAIVYTKFVQSQSVLFSPRTCPLATVIWSEKSGAWFRTFSDERYSNSSSRYY
jgi:hypothetical protein